MHYSLAELANHVDGELSGDENLMITHLSTLEQAQQGSLSFFHNEQYRNQLRNTNASAVILNPKNRSLTSQAAILVDNPYYAYAKIAQLFEYKPAQPKQFIHPTAQIGQNCDIAATAIIGAFAVIHDNVTIGDETRIKSHSTIGEGCCIGSHCLLEANVHIQHHVKLGDRVTLASGVVVGCEGFGHAWHEGQWHKVPQLGSVIIADDVDIGANTTIDRGALQDTVIGQGVRLDNQIQIGHNVQIGDYTVVAGCVGVAGSTQIGRHCMIGGGAGISGHLTLTDNVILTGMSMVTQSIYEAGVYSSGTGLQDNRTWRKNVVRFRYLDKLYRQVKGLEKKMKDRGNK